MDLLGEETFVAFPAFHHRTWTSFDLEQVLVKKLVWKHLEEAVLDTFRVASFAFLEGAS